MLKKWWKAAQIYMDKRMLTMIALGFSSGFPLLLVFGTLNLWLKDAGISYAAIGLFSLVKTPYLVADNRSHTAAFVLSFGTPPRLGVFYPDNPAVFHSQHVYR